MVNAILLDTQSWAWSLTADPRFWAGARSAIAAAGSVTVSPVSFFEIAQRVRVGKWPKMGAHVDRLIALLDQQNRAAKRLHRNPRSVSPPA